MSKITKDMPISDVLKMDMASAPIFLEFGMHCIGCPMASSESIEAASASHGINADDLVKKLNEYFDSKQ
jgi:hybrid cluster-associated redox disulfide protein